MYLPDGCWEEPLFVAIDQATAWFHAPHRKLGAVKVYGMNATERIICDRIALSAWSLGSMTDVLH